MLFLSLWARQIGTDADGQLEGPVESNVQKGLLVVEPATAACLWQAAPALDDDDDDDDDDTKLVASLFLASSWIIATELERPHEEVQCHCVLTLRDISLSSPCVSKPCGPPHGQEALLPAWWPAWSDAERCDESCTRIIDIDFDFNFWIPCPTLRGCFGAPSTRRNERRASKALTQTSINQSIQHAVLSQNTASSQQDCSKLSPHPPFRHCNKQQCIHAMTLPSPHLGNPMLIRPQQWMRLSRRCHELEHLER
jgi:hypothetical protein